jgi:hypothetical protein
MQQSFAKEILKKQLIGKHINFNLRIIQEFRQRFQCRFSRR